MLDAPDVAVVVRVRGGAFEIFVLRRSRDLDGLGRIVVVLAAHGRLDRVWRVIVVCSLAVVLLYVHDLFHRFRWLTLWRNGFGRLYTELGMCVLEYGLSIVFQLLFLVLCCRTIDRVKLRHRVGWIGRVLQHSTLNLGLLG
uniref:Uncharacterized protein n=1 Tax=Anopheles christyi TaxID=43041 RepID=A0A182KIR0_9DIPT